MAESTLLARIARFEPFAIEGRVIAISSGSVTATGPDAELGARCELITAANGAVLGQARIAALSADNIQLVPLSHLGAVRIGDSVRLLPDAAGLTVGDGFAGRAVDALGGAIDAGAPVRGAVARRTMPAVLNRVPPNQPLVTGVRAIDGMLTIGRGARMGIFSASGVGKTRLVSQILRQSTADRVVVCLVGERGREAEALWASIVASESHARTSIVIATADEPAAMRAQAVDQALALAEFWRDTGEDVVFILDSVTRYALALREIGLVAGEPPTVRGFTPNVFAELPRIVESCGSVRNSGSITALFTVLCETDEADDPLVEVMKSLLDGHIILSRRLAQMGHFPAIDIGRSISRLFDRLADREQQAAAQICRAWLARFDESRILVESGMYKAGNDSELDAAIAAQPQFNAFLRQGSDESEPWATMLTRLHATVGRRP